MLRILTIWYGSGSADPCLWLMDPDQDSDPAIFVIHKKKILLSFCLIPTFWRYIYIIFQRQKVKKKSQNSKNQGFSFYFCLMTEGSKSGTVHLTYGSGSGSKRPKNIRIRRIRFRNTGKNKGLLKMEHVYSSHTQKQKLQWEQKN